MPCIKGCLISKVCAEAYSGTKQPPCATELVVPSQHADNNARDEIICDCVDGDTCMHEDRSRICNLPFGKCGSQIKSPVA